MQPGFSWECFPGVTPLFSDLPRALRDGDGYAATPESVKPYSSPMGNA